jgi:hypothetical protein
MFTFDPADVRAFDIIASKFLTNVPAKTMAGKIRNPGFWSRFAVNFGRGAALATFRRKNSLSDVGPVS